MIDAAALNRLKWRSRRGLLENDLFVQRFFDRHGATLEPRHAVAFESLMALDDRTLLDLLLRRTEPVDLPPGSLQSPPPEGALPPWGGPAAGGLDRAEVRDVLSMIRTEEPR